MKKDKYGFELTIQRRLFLLSTWWDFHRDWYIYNWNFKLNKHPFYKVWHRSGLVRDIDWYLRYKEWPY